MRQEPGTANNPAEKVVKDIRRRTEKHHSAEERIRIVLDGLRGEDSIAEHSRRERIVTRRSSISRVSRPASAQLRHWDSFGVLLRQPSC